MILEEAGGPQDRFFINTLPLAKINTQETGGSASKHSAVKKATSFIVAKNRIMSSLTRSPETRTAMSSLSLIEDFSMHIGVVSHVFQSRTSRELFNNLAVALKRLFKVKSVNFLMTCTEAIDTL